MRDIADVLFMTSNVFPLTTVLFVGNQLKYPILILKPSVWS